RCCFLPFCLLYSASKRSVGQKDAFGSDFVLVGVGKALRSCLAGLSGCSATVCQPAIVLMSNSLWARITFAIGLSVCDALFVWYGCIVQLLRLCVSSQ